MPRLKEPTPRVEAISMCGFCVASKPQLLNWNRRSLFAWLGPLLLVQTLAGCSSIGPGRLENDQIDYSRTLSEVDKQQTLFNLVRLRYADTPMFASVQQMVAGYTLQASVQAGGQAAVAPVSASDFGTAQGAVQYSDHPTFTFAPLTGQRFVEAYLRPLPPADIMPLIQGNVPVDLLFRLVAQAVGPLQNTHPLGGADRSGSPQFTQTLEDLRVLQERGVLRVRLQRDKEKPRLFLNFETRLAPDTEAFAARVCRLLEIECRSELEVVNGDHLQQLGRNKIPVLTRSLLDVLAAVAAEIQVPEEDVQDGETIATMRAPGNRRPIIIIHTGPTKPTASYVAAQIDGKWFWVERTDFSSKLAFTILEILKSVAESPSSIAPPVLTIPAG
jgi:hypothetical protein